MPQSIFILLLPYLLFAAALAVLVIRVIRSLKRPSNACLNCPFNPRSGVECPDPGLTERFHCPNCDPE